MHGNVWEWCEDDWHKDYQGAPTDGSAWLPKSSSKVIRGGSWDEAPANCRSAYRLITGVNRSLTFGFRVVRVAPTDSTTPTMTRLIIRREQKQTQYFTEDLGDGVELDMVRIPGGSFWMGTEDEEIERLCKTYNVEYFRKERPQHKVTIPTFFMGRYPITQEQWRIVAGWEQVERKIYPDSSNFKEPYEKIDRWQRPVESISWEDAKEFCNRLSKKTKRQYRLPTEAEWEYACRAVISDQLSVSGGNLTKAQWNEQYNQPFHFGETISTQLANYYGNDIYGRGVEGEYRRQTTPVGYFEVANAFGLYDMHGNVWECCEDDWHENYEDAPIDGSAWLSEQSNAKVICGGSWGSHPNHCRSAYRNFITRDYRYSYIGFRVVRVAPRT